MEFYERCSGSRMHAAFNKPAMFFEDFIELNLLHDILFFVKNCYSSIEEIHNVLTYNTI
jgi:NADH:ubiquinone oxidoreductase subunit D